MQTKGMKKVIGIFCTALFPVIVFSQGVTIGSSSPPDPSAVLDVQSTQKGLLFPRMTAAQRNAIVLPAEGLTIYNTDSRCIETYFPAGWTPVGCECTTPPPTPVAVNGPVHACPSQSGVVFTVQPVPGAVSYTWVIPNQDVLVSGQGTGSIQVDFSGNPGIRTISVVAANSCGTSSSFSISVDISNPSAAFTYTPQSPTNNVPVTFTATAPNLTYAWTFPSGNPSSSANSPEVVTWANAGTYSVSLQVTDADGCTASGTSSVVVSNCPPPGSQTATFNYTGSIQTWTVPSTCAGSVTIAVKGAQGGAGQSSGTGGLGAYIIGTFTNLTPGSVLQIVVGGQGVSGVNGNASRGGGGGGGSFVYTQGGNPTLLIAAGGGGGGGFSTGNGGNGLITANGGNGNYGAPGGTNGQGGGITTSNGYDGGGGAGWLSDGQSNTQASGGKTRTNNWVGGGANAYSPLGVNGGFGGGGGAEHGAGGGGGYSGGGGGRNGSPYGAGGGGSFNGGTNQTNTPGSNSGNGQVVISY